MAAPAQTVSAGAQAHPAANVRVRRQGQLPLGTQLLLQLLCLFITFTVLFPILWVFSMSINPRDISHPTDLIPPGATLDAYTKVIEKPTLNPVSFGELA